MRHDLRDSAEARAERDSTVELTIEAIAGPREVAAVTDGCLARACSLGFRPLGWLRVQLLQSVVMACHSNADGGVSLALLGGETSGSFAHHHVDLVSHLDGGRKLVTTTMPFVLSQPARGLFKHAHPGVGLAELLERHLAYVRELGDAIGLRVHTLAEFEQSVRDYVALELGFFSAS